MKIENLNEIRDKPLCEYGCGQEANYQFKNGKWCCSKSSNSCPNRRIELSCLKKNKSWEEIYGKEYALFFKEKRKISLKNKSYEERYGYERAQQIKQKISKKSKGKKISEEHKKRISLTQRNKKISEEQKENQRLIMTGRKDSVKTKSLKSKKGLLRYENKIERVKYKLSIEDIKQKYSTFSKVETMRYNPNKPGEKEIQVHCKNNNCKNSKEEGGWFTPTYISLYERIRHVERDDGNGASYLYCSEECKQECPLYNKQLIQLINEDKIKAGIIKTPLYTNSEYNIWRTEVLNRANNLCEYCGSPAEHVHHSRPQKLEPGFILDPDFGIACCEKCHYKYGHKINTECSTGNLANKICK